MKRWAVTTAAIVLGCGQILGVDGLRDRDADVDVDAPIEASLDGGVECGPILHGGVCTPFPQCGCPTGENCEITNPNGFASCTQVTTTPLWHACNGFGV